MHVARKVYEDMREGNSLSTKELLDAYHFFKRVAHDLNELGPVFRLAAVEANRTTDTMADYLRARGVQIDEIARASSS